LTEIVSPQAMMKALHNTLQPRILDLNIEAFTTGLKYQETPSMQPFEEEIK
jgi:hypothetical protein